MTSPCHCCLQRTAVPNCHATCEAYKRYNAEREVVRENRRREIMTGWHDQWRDNPRLFGEKRKQT